MFMKTFSSLGIFIILAMFNVAHATGASCTGHSCNTTNTTTTNNQGGQGGVGLGVGIAGAEANAAAIAGAQANVDVKNSTNVLNTIGNTNKVDNTNLNLNGQDQSQKQGQTQKTENSNNASQTVTFAAPKTYRPVVSSAIAPTNFPTAPCMGSSSIAGGGSLVSVSAGTSWESENCIILETARNFEEAGYKEDAMHVRCQGEYAKLAPSCKALARGESLEFDAATLAAPVETAAVVPTKADHVQLEAAKVGGYDPESQLY